MEEKRKRTFKKLLSNRHIAFLDVVKEGIVIIDSSSDNDIYPFILDKEYLLGIDFNNPHLKIVANSQNAYEAFKTITNKEVDVIPQSLYGQWSKYKNKKELQQAWNGWFKNKPKI